MFFIALDSNVESQIISEPEGSQHLFAIVPGGDRCGKLAVTPVIGLALSSELEAQNSDVRVKFKKKHMNKFEYCPVRSHSTYRKTERDSPHCKENRISNAVPER